MKAAPLKIEPAPFTLVDQKELHMKKTLLILLPFLFFGCAKSTEKSVDSFEKFAAGVKIEPTENCNRACTKLKEEFRYVVYVGEQVYCYWDEKQKEYGLDFKQQAADFENQINNSTTDTQYFYLLVKWAALFHDGHVNAMLKEDTSKLDLFNLNIRFEVLAPGTDHEQLIVAKAGSVMKVGTVITKIQGKDWKEYLSQADKFSSGSTLGMRRSDAGRAIIRVLLETEGAKAIKLEGRFKDADVTEVMARTMALYDGAKEPEGPEETGLELIQSSLLANNIGYLRIDGFEGTKMTELLEQAMDRMMGTSGLIIDVRRNGGGDLSGNAVLSRLISEPVARFHQRTNFSDMLRAFRPDIFLDYDYSDGRFSEMKSRMVKPVEDSHKQYKMPVMVLTSPNCFSACDTFVSALKENKLALVVGEPTGGGTGNPIGFSLPLSEHRFRYSVAQGYTAVGKTLLEGKGTLPDVVLEPTLEERTSGQDLQLEKTLKMMAEKIAQAQPGNSEPAPVPELAAELKAVPLLKADLPIDIEIDREVRHKGETE